jgi:hypothetical protein
LSRALIALLAVLALSACAEVDAHYLGGEDLVPVDAGSVADTGAFPFDLAECMKLQDDLREFLLSREADAAIPDYCLNNPFLAECPYRDLVRQAYDCAGRIRQQLLDEANARR